MYLLFAPAKEVPDPEVFARGLIFVKSFKPLEIVGTELTVSFDTLIAAPVLPELIMLFFPADTITSLRLVTEGERLTDISATLPRLRLISL